MSLNQMTILGRVGRDAEYTQHGETGFLKFSVATSKKFKGEEATTWHNVTIIGKLADAIKNYVRKGQEIFVQGELNKREYEKDGQKREFVEIVVGYGGVVQMVGKRPDNTNSAPAASTPAAPMDLDDEVPF
jgi:single-strand DNA-binding protein